MVIRIVKLTIQDKNIRDFEALVKRNFGKIRSQAGCTRLEVLQDKYNPGIFFTYSHWQEEKNLNEYRNSELFNEVWGTAKTYFASKPEAWTTEKKELE